MNRTIARSIGVALAALFAATGSASAQEKFTFALNWFAVGDHAAYWVALDKGYYKAKGLDVTLENSKGSGDSMAKVDTGRADAGLADVAAVVPFIAKGGTIKVVGMVFDKTPLNIFSLKSKPLNKPKDLEGASLGSPPGDAQRQVFPAFAKLTGIDASKITWVNIDPAAKIAALVEKRMDGVSDYTTGLPLYEKAGGKGNIVMMKWADFGFDLYAMSIMASAKTMKDKPKQLKAFIEASYMGWRDVMADPDAALAIQKKHVPELDLSTIKENMAMGLDLMKTDQYRKGGIGSIDDKRMCASVDLMNNYMSMPKKVECKDVYTQDFFTKVEMPK